MISAAATATKVLRIGLSADWSDYLAAIDAPPVKRQNLALSCCTFVFDHWKFRQFVVNGTALKSEYQESNSRSPTNDI